MPDTSGKIARLRNYMKDRKIDGVVLSSRANFAWLTGGGDNHVVSQSESGSAAIYVTNRQVSLIADSIEAPRLVKEEPVGEMTVKEHPWAQPLAEAVAKVLGKSKKKVLSDEPLRIGQPGLDDDFVDEVRAELFDSDIRKYRQLGRDCAIAIEAVARHMSVGDSGFQVEADLARHLLVRGIQPYVLLVGFDDRLKRSRHPVPTVNHLRHHAMLVVCGQREGLIANLTRVVHFGPVPAEILSRHESVCRVEAAMWAATRPGMAWKDAFKAGQAAYKKEGFDGEWELHHQGGPTGFAGRDFLVHAGEDRLIHDCQAVAWNPSITGTKSEDTFILKDDERLVVTACTKNWPTLTVKADGQEFERPAILVR
jgi:Xaa-Pro dipeptidase